MQKEAGRTKILHTIAAFIDIRRIRRIEKQKTEEMEREKLRSLLTNVHTTYFANGEDGFQSQALPFYEADKEEVTGALIGQLIYEGRPSGERIFRFKFQTVETSQDFRVRIFGKQLQVSQGTAYTAHTFLRQFIHPEGTVHNIPSQRHVGQPQRR